jgi:ABC-type taurine transport system ATPase subunit
MLASLHGSEVPVDQRLPVVVWKNVSYTVSTNVKAGKTFTIINDCSGELRMGSVCVVLGPSGCVHYVLIL